jgi:hypothetical protein
MITGVHALMYSDRAEQLRAFLRDVLDLPNVDVGHGWLIFALPPSELAVHPADPNSPRVELYLMCDDVDATIAELAGKGVECDAPTREERWGRVTAIHLPDGGRLGLYEPKHPRPQPS